MSLHRRPFGMRFLSMRGQQSADGPVLRAEVGDTLVIDDGGMGGAAAYRDDHRGDGPGRMPYLVRWLIGSTNRGSCPVRELTSRSITWLRAGRGIDQVCRGRSPRILAVSWSRMEVEGIGAGKDFNWTRTTAGNEAGMRSGPGSDPVPSPPT